MEPRLLLGILVAAPALAGCLATSTIEPTTLAPPLAACAEDATDCPWALTAPPSIAGEPAAAAHPSKRGTFAVAATLLPTPTASLRGTPPASTANSCVVTVHATADGGKTWTDARPPTPSLDAFGPGPFHDVCARSPSVAFAPDGTLHLVAAATATTWTRALLDQAAWRVPGFDPPDSLTEGTTPTRVYATRSADGGATWEPAEVLRADANHPYVAFDGSGRGVVTLRLFEGDGFQASEILFLGSQRAVRLPCHLPTRAVFDGDEAVVACNDHTAMPDAMGVRVYAVPSGAGEPALRGEVRVPGAKNLFPTLARATDGTLALVVTPTVRGGFVDGDSDITTSGDGGRTFSGFRNLRGLLAPEAENVAWTAVAADDAGRFHVAPVFRRGEQVEAFHAVMDRDGAVLASAVLQSFQDLRPAPTDPLEHALPRWRHAGYAGLAPEAGAVLVASAWNADRVLEARLTRLTE